MTLLRYGRNEYNRQQRRLIIAIVGTICTLTFIIFFGFPLFVNFSLIVEKFKGTSSPSVTKEIVLAPTLDPLPEATNSAALIVTGRAHSGATLLLYVNDSETKKLTVPDSGNFKTSVIGKVGVNVISAKALGKNGILSELSNVITTKVINSAPFLDITIPEDGATYSGDKDTISFEGKTDENNSVTVNGRFAVVGSDGKFTYTLKLSEGDTIIIVEATDQAGNKTSLQRRVAYQK